MSVTATNQGPVSATTRWLRGLWSYYRGYVDTAMHAVATAALTGFGLLIFVDPLFAILAIASYLCPPVVLYVLDADAGKPSESPETTVSSRATPRTEPNSDSHTSSDGDSDADSDDGDTDSDSDDSDTDSDSDDGDTDSDSDDGDTDG